MVILTFMAISSMRLVGCSAALVPAPASASRRPPLGKICLRATLAALLAGMLRPRALDKIELTVLVIAAWIWVLKKLKRRAPTILRNVVMICFENKLPVLCNWHGPHSQLAILDPEQCFGHLTRILGRILLLHIADGTPTPTFWSSLSARVAVTSASAHHGLHHLHVLVHGGHVGHARAVHHPLHHRAHRFS